MNEQNDRAPSDPQYGQQNPQYGQQNPQYGQQNPQYGQQNPQHAPGYGQPPLTPQQQVRQQKLYEQAQKKANRPLWKKKRLIFPVGALLFISACTALISGGADNNPVAVPAASTSTSAPKSKVPETKAPKSKEPKTKAPEAKAPETKAPEAKAPEAKAPKAKAPKAKAPAAPEEPTQEEETSGYTTEQENAIEKANSYLDFAAFSRSGLIEQLVFEGFSKKDSTLAVKSLDTDWNEQAAKKAESYLDYSSFSRSGLIEQLEFEGFTTKQATYGAKQAFK